MDVRHYEEVVVTKKPIDRGHLFTLADFETRRQDVTNVSGYGTSPDQFVGQKAKRVFPESQVIRANDVETPTRSTALLPVVVKRRDRVTAFARSGSLSVTSIWEVQQDGRVGEVIKCKNIQSNKEVCGRVISATEVEATD
jgi:flagella basal body P-ring formation protein FlgA